MKIDGSAKPVRLDDKDRILLKMLQDNGELSLSAMGSKLGLTKMSVSNRIKRLRNAQVLLGSHFRVNPTAVGQDYLLVCQVTCDVSGPKMETLASKIAQIHGVQTVYMNFGHYDILFIARRPDKESAKDLVYQISLIPGIRNTLTTIPHTVLKESLEISLDA